MAMPQILSQTVTLAACERNLPHVRRIQPGEPRFGDLHA